MHNSLLSFEKVPWETPSMGVQQKVISVDDHQKMRLVRFTEEFVEDDWCTKGHLGYIVKGEMNIAFSDSILHYKAGDGLHIKQGLPHKAQVEKGKLVELILFESE